MLKAARAAPIFAALKAVAPAAVLAFSVAGATAADAAIYVMQNGSMDHPRAVSISGIGSNIQATPVQFDGYVEGDPDVPFNNLVAFCVDVYHNVTLTNYDPDLTYTDEVPLTHDSNPYDPDPLTQSQIVQIGRLVNYGTNVFYNASQATSALRETRWNTLAAVQGAIWQVVSGRNVYSSNYSLNVQIDRLAGSNYNAYFNPTYGAVNRRITFLTPFKGSKQYPYSKLTQSFAITNAIPEPATWVMMIGGFAIAGGVLRRARRKGAVAA